MTLDGNPPNCRIGLIGLPFDSNSSFMRGAAHAPPLIRESFYSEAANLWSELGIDLGEPHTFFDAGDLSASEELGEAAEIEAGIDKLLANDLLPLSLGGDHSVTYPVIKSVARKRPELSILHFDAHPDLYHNFQNNPFSHASPFARIMESGLAKRLVQVGIRTINDHQKGQARRFGVEVIEMRHWRADLNIEFDTPVYISFDMDGLDPAFAPGVSHREPGGLSTRQAIDIIHRVNQPVVGADIVEFNPRMDPSGVTAVVCAKLMKEIAAKMLISNRNQS